MLLTWPCEGEANCDCGCFANERSRQKCLCRDVNAPTPLWAAQVSSAAEANSMGTFSSWPGGFCLGASKNWAFFAVSMTFIIKIILLRVGTKGSTPKRKRTSPNTIQNIPKYIHIYIYALLQISSPSKLERCPSDLPSNLNILWCHKLLLIWVCFSLKVRT